MGCDIIIPRGLTYHGAFQSTHPSGVRPKVRARQAWATGFNPRTPVGCDNTPHNKPTGPMSFNPRTPVGCDYPIYDENHRAELFQSTHPSGVRLSINGRGNKTAWFQSTHPSGVRPPPKATIKTPLRVSIHAPQWGATHHRHAVRSIRQVSIHAPQWGATFGHPIQRHRKKGFNPRTPVGCDQMINSRLTPIASFNPRTPVGCDLSMHSNEAGGVMFQSTHPSGVRLREWA